MQTVIRLLLICTFAFCIFSCKPSNNRASAGKVDTINYTNLIILIDLSDRNLADGNDAFIDPNQVLRDTTIIRDILLQFEDQVKKHGFQYAKDKIQLLIAPQPDNKQIDFNPNIDIEKMVLENKIVRQVLRNETNTFLNEVKTIYSGNPKFTGADIWSFFKDFPPSLLVKGTLETSKETSIYSNFKNKIIILTDGYLVFKSAIQVQREIENSCTQVDMLRNNKNWEEIFDRFKMKPIIGKDFSNLEVLLLEINPVHPEINTNEVEIIERYWKEWFIDMGIKYNGMCQVNQSIPTVKTMIKYFMDN